MRKLFLAVIAVASLNLQANDFTFTVKNYESFGGSIPVKVTDIRAQVISESFSQTNKKCYKRTGLWSSESKPYTAKQSLNYQLDGNQIVLDEAITSLAVTARLVMGEVRPDCEVRSQVKLLVKAKTIDTNKEYLLHGDIYLDKERDTFYLQSGGDYYFLENPEVSLVKMPRIPVNILEEIWESYSPRYSDEIETNF